MVVFSIPRTSRGSGLRPLDPSRDLHQVADLIQAAFSSELDESGQAMLDEMRQLGQWGLLLRWLDQPSASLSQMMSGFVWVEDGKVVGNVTVSPMSISASRWAISNVAVDPVFRGRGMARRLMEAALEYAASRGGHVVTLQVRADNDAALHLYRTMGFGHVFGTAHLRLNAGSYQWRPVPVTHGMRLRRFDDYDARGSYRLARDCTPEEVQAEQPITGVPYQLGWTTRLSDWLKAAIHADPPLRMVVEREGRMLAVMTAIADASQAIGRISLLVHPAQRGHVETPMLVAGVNHLFEQNKRSVLAQHPTYHPEGVDACLRLGFSLDRTLLWMRKTLR